MPKSQVSWCWEEAFSKFGFGDGDGPNFTDEVAAFFRELGFEVDCDNWGIHNYMIMSIKAQGREQLPLESDKYRFGYDDPREYLNKALVLFLDEKFPADGAHYLF